MRLLVPVLALGVLLSALAGLLLGPVPLSPRAVLGALCHPQAGDSASVIVGAVRLPRVVAGLAVGLALGLSGAVLQGLLRNPLVEPGLLGVTTGASFGAVIAIYWGFAALSPLAAPLFSLGGAASATAAALALGRGAGTATLVLAGAAVNSIAAAAVSLALNLAPSPYAAYEITTWLLGSLADRSWADVTLALPFIAIGTLLLLLTGRALDALALGEEQAESLGVDLGRVRLLALLGTASAVGAASAIAGAVGFVGLVAPHLVRPLVGHRPSATLLPAALAGALVVSLADLVTRLVPASPELRLGVVVALVGAPFFLWLVLHLRRADA